MEKPQYDVFLSHATPDKPVVEALARILTDRGFSPWLDKWNLIPGEPWQEAIEKALEDCVACAVCLGPSGTGPWQNEEMRAAIDRRVSDRSHQFRVIPVLLPGSDRGEPSRLPAFLRNVTWAEFRETLDDEKALHRLICGIRGIPPGPDPGEAVAEGARPYRGLQVFDVGDALFFFGREALTEWLLHKLRSDRSGSRFLAIVGPSGSGKSSLARAGLLASLKRGEIPGSDTWPIAVCKPGAQPLESLAIALSGATRLGDSPSAVRDLIRDFGTDQRMLHLTTRLSLRDAPADRRLVVLMDQFEEVFTLCLDEAQRRAIIDNLLHAAAAADGQTMVVLTIRADFYDRCAVYPDLAAAISDRQSLVGPMTRDELRSVIERPAYLTGCELEGGLADLLLNEVESQPGSLPLLEHALLQIWQRKEGGRRLTIDAYREIGGMAGALEKHAEEVYAGFSEEEKEACHQIFLRLVQVDEQGRATKRRLGLNELAPAASPIETVVSRLTNARLLTTDQEKQPTVELAHEALLSNWGRLKQWIEQDREALRTRRRLDEAVAEWLSKDRDPAFLLEGGRLVQIEEWAESHKDEMGLDARELLAASITGRDQERQRELSQAKALEEEQRRRADAEHQRAEEQVRAGRRLRKWAIAFAVTAALAIAAAAAVLHFRQVSERQRKLDLASHLAERANPLLTNDPTVSLLLAIQATRLAVEGGQPHLPPAEVTLRSAVLSSQGSPFATGKIRAAALSSDSRRLALFGADGVISIWDLKPNGEVVEITNFTSNQPPATIRQLAIGKDGKWLLCTDSNGSSQLFDFGKQGTKIIDLGREDWLSDIDPFSPDGRLLLTRSEGSRWKVRDLTKPGQPEVAYLRISPKNMVFSPDSHWLAIVEQEGLRIWNLERIDKNFQHSPSSPIITSGTITALAFSSDSQWIVTEEREHRQGNVIQAWRIAQPQHEDAPNRLNKCAWSEPGGPNVSDPSLSSRLSILWKCLPYGEPDDVTFSLFLESNHVTALAINSRAFAIGTATGGLLIKDLTSGRIRTYRKFLRGPVKLLALAGRSLISQSADEAPRVLDWPITNFDTLVKDLSPDGLQLIYEGYHNYRLRGSEGDWPLAYSGEEGAPWRFSSDSRWLATIGPDHKPLVWHLDSKGKPSLQASSFSSRYAHSRPVTALLFSPDNHWLASGDESGQLRLWDLWLPGSEPVALVNHGGPVTALAFNHDSHLLASAGDDGVVRISKIVAGQMPRALLDSPGKRDEPVKALAFLSDDRLAMGGRGDRILLWHSSREAALENSGFGIRELQSNPQGTHLAGIAGNGSIQIWYPAEDGNLLHTPVILGNVPVYLLRFTADGNTLETNSQFESLHHVELRTDKLLEAACRAVGRNLTEREWKEYIPSELYQEREPCPEFPKAFD